MAKTIKLPLVGDVRTTYVWAGAGIAGGIVLWAWWRRAQSTDDDTGPAYDPATGSLAAPYPAEPAPYINPAPARTYDPTDEGDAGSEPTSPEEWSRRAIEELSYVGMEAGAVSAAIGRYLSEQTLTGDQASIVRQAWALAGKPTFLPRLRLGEDGDGDDDAEGEQLERLRGLRQQSFLLGGRRTLVRWNRDDRATAVELQLIRNGRPVWSGVNPSVQPAKGNEGEQLFDTSKGTPYLVRARNYVDPTSNLASGPWVELRFTTPKE